MKNRSVYLLCAALFLWAQAARAADSDLSFTCEKKKFDDRATVQARADESLQTDKWGYNVTVENQGFTNLSNLQVKYIIFYKHEQLGVKGPPRKESKSGTFSIPEIDSLGKTSFNTLSIALTKSTLEGYTYFINGAKARASDSLTGIWIRVYQNGTLFAEYSYPEGLTSIETWK